MFQNQTNFLSGFSRRCKSLGELKKKLWEHSPINSCSHGISLSTKFLRVSNLTLSQKNTKDQSRLINLFQTALEIFRRSDDADRENIHHLVVSRLEGWIKHIPILTASVKFHFHHKVSTFIYQTSLGL